MATVTLPAWWGVEQLVGHLAAELAFLGVCGVVAGLGQWPASRAAVHVDVLHADQPGAVRFGRGEHTGLEGREFLHPTLVRWVQRLIHEAGAAGDVDGELSIGGVAAHDLNVIGYSGGAGAIDHPYGLAAAKQGVQGGQADGAGTEDDVTRHAVHTLLKTLASTGVAPAGVVGRGSSRLYNNRPERAEKVTAPLALKMVTCSSTGIPASVVTIQPSAHSGGIATPTTSGVGFEREASQLGRRPTRHRSML